MNFDAKYLRERLHYDPETGVFTWAEGTIKAGRIAGSRNAQGYLTICILGKNRYCHRLAWMYVYGEWPIDQIDHKNRIRDDNRIDNLRLATNAQNSANKDAPSNNTSGVKGVHWHSTAGKWQASLSVGGRRIYLGLHDDIEAAASTRAAAEDTFRLDPDLVAQIPDSPKALIHQRKGAA